MRCPAASKVRRGGAGRTRCLVRCLVRSTTDSLTRPRGSMHAWTCSAVQPHMRCTVQPPPHAHLRVASGLAERVHRGSASAAAQGPPPATRFKSRCPQHAMPCHGTSITCTHAPTRVLACAAAWVAEHKAQRPGNDVLQAQVRIWVRDGGSCTRRRVEWSGMRAGHIRRASRRAVRS